MYQPAKADGRLAAPPNRPASNWRCATVETPSNGDVVLVMSDVTRETWTGAPVD
jgi:hypothetical protein